MIESVIFSKKQGMGYISDGEAPPHFKKEAFVVDETIRPGDETTLKGHFCRPLRYLGIKDSTEMVFFNGEENGKFYFTTVQLITPLRIFEMYKHDSGRDFNWINGKWK